MMKSVFVGWICRTWVESFAGWDNEIHRFNTEEEANEYGWEHNRNLGSGELSREYEVYKDFELRRA